jgi:hypothetical protein
MEFRILGPLEIVGEHGPVTLHRGKEQALLAFMLLHANELLPSERLIDELWDERPPATAPKILQNAVSQLRRALGDGRLETRAPGYVFHLEAGELDLDRFERLAREGRNAEAFSCGVGRLCSSCARNGLLTMRGVVWKPSALPSSRTASITTWKRGGTPSWCLSSSSSSRITPCGSVSMGS